MNDDPSCILMNDDPHIWSPYGKWMMMDNWRWSIYDDGWLKMMDDWDDGWWWMPEDDRYLKMMMDNCRWSDDDGWLMMMDDWWWSLKMIDMWWWWMTDGEGLLMMMDGW